MRLTHGEMKIRCDKAVQYLSRNEIDLRGNVKIIRGKMIINTKEAHYDGNNKITNCKNGVELFRNRFHVIAEQGIYFSNEDRAEFKGKVEAKDSVSIINCEELKYFEKDEKAIALKNVRVSNNDKSMVVNSQKLEHYEKNGLSKFSIKPILVQVDTTEDGVVDTLAVSSEIMDIYDDSTQQMIAVGNVLLAKGNLGVKCKNLNYERANEKIIFTSEPWLWYENSQISGDTIIAKLKNRNLEQLEINKRAFMSTLNDSVNKNRYDQMSGKKIKLNFENKNLNNISIDGNATSLYYLFDEGRSKGANKTSGDKISINFLDGKISTIAIKKGVEGIYFPEKMIRANPLEVNLEGFIIKEGKPTIKKIIFGEKN